MKIETNLGRLPTDRAISGKKGPEGKPQPKTLGEVPPVIERLEDHPQLASLFAHYGSIQKLRRKLKQFSGKDCKKIVLARNTVGAADNKGIIYLGVQFLEQNGNNLPLLGAVMAHEWGHMISNTTKLGNLDHLSWDDIFGLRRDEEASADAFCGRMLAMMEYPCQGPNTIIDFLIKAEKGTPTVKYYAAPIRAAIIREAHRRHSERRKLTHKLFPKKTYANPYASKPILVDE